jgi:hypothetical protein
VLLLSILIGTTLAESSISTDRPSVGTSALVLQKGSIQLESGIQRYSYSEEEGTNCTDSPCNIQYNIDTFYNMVRIGITPTFEIRPYNDLNFTDLSSTITGIQGKINLYSSDENSHAFGILVSGDRSSSQITSSALGLWDFGGDMWSGWINGGAIMQLDNGNVTPTTTVGFGTTIGTDHNIYSELVYTQDSRPNVIVSGGYYKVFANYQLDFFALKNLTSYKTWQVGIGFSWKIK